VSWYDPTSWNVDWLGGNTAAAPPTQYKDQSQITGIINSGIAGVDGRQAPQTGTTQLGAAARIDPSQQGQFRDLQMQQANRLNAISSGQQMGPGEMAAQRAAQSAYAQQVGMANMQRGGGAPGAGIAAARNQVTIAGNAAGQGAQAAMSDQQNANAQLTNALNAGRSTDVGLATSQAGLNQQTTLQQGQMDQATKLANLDAQLRQTGMNDQARLAYLQQLTGMDANQLNASLQLYGVQKGAGSGLLGSLMSQGGQVAGMAAGAGGGAGAGAGGAAAMASDERLKTNITDARSEIDAMLDGLAPRSYDYKDQKWGKGRRAGIMAQDLERSAAGKRIVMETSEGKMLDVNKALSASLAASARLNERVRMLEGKGGKDVA
jgi:hypothetical protein